MQDYVAHWVSQDKILPVLLDSISTVETEVELANKSYCISSSFFKNLRFTWGSHPAQFGSTHYM